MYREKMVMDVACMLTGPLMAMLKTKLESHPIILQLQQQLERMTDLRELERRKDEAMAHLAGSLSNSTCCSN